MELYKATHNSFHDESMFSLDGVMKLKQQFKDLRVSLSFNTNFDPEALKTDPLIRIRPLIRIFNHKNESMFMLIGPRSYRLQPDQARR